MMTATQASFLRAAVKAGKSIVVAGPQGAGKTTLVRALCGRSPWEAIGTFETEFELHLHELTDVHPIVHAWEARPGSGEISRRRTPGRGVHPRRGSLRQFRFNLPARSSARSAASEVWAMIKAMESGAGLHLHHPRRRTARPRSASSSPVPWKRARTSPTSWRRASSPRPST